MLSNSIYEANINLIPKPDKEKTKKIIIDQYPWWTDKKYSIKYLQAKFKKIILRPNVNKISKNHLLLLGLMSFLGEGVRRHSIISDTGI